MKRVYSEVCGRRNFQDRYVKKQKNSAHKTKPVCVAVDKMSSHFLNLLSCSEDNVSARSSKAKLLEYTLK